jgi:hypothetical protein
MFKIEKKIPVPTDLRKKRKYPFREMMPGDSIFVNSDTPKHKVYSAAEAYGRAQHPRWRFAVRMEGDGVRCWRVE